MNCPKCGSIAAIAEAHWTKSPFEIYYCPKCRWIEEWNDRHGKNEEFNPSRRYN